MQYNKIASVSYMHMTSVSYPTCNKRKQAIAYDLGGEGIYGLSLLSGDYFIIVTWV